VSEHKDSLVKTKNRDGRDDSVRVKSASLNP
jgi:hypothetical protein